MVEKLVIQVKTLPLLAQCMLLLIMVMLVNRSFVVIQQGLASHVGYPEWLSLVKLLV